MHITAWTGDSEILQYLASVSSNITNDVNVRNNHDQVCFKIRKSLSFSLYHSELLNLIPQIQTPLHIAALRGQYNAAKTLLDHGAEVDALNQNRYSQTPLHIAALKG